MKRAFNRHPFAESFPALCVKWMPSVRLFCPFYRFYHLTNELVGGNALADALGGEVCNVQHITHPFQPQFAPCLLPRNMVHYNQHKAIPCQNLHPSVTFYYPHSLSHQKSGHKCPNHHNVPYVPTIDFKRFLQPLQLLQSLLPTPTLHSIKKHVTSVTTQTYCMRKPISSPSNNSSIDA